MGKKVKKEVKPSEFSFDAYKKMLRDPRLPQYTHETVIADGRAAKAGDIQARNRLILGHLKYVVDVASHFTGRGLPIEDLVGIGNEALIEVIDEKYDPDYALDPNAKEDPEHPKNKKLKRNPGQLTTYSKFYIEGAIRKALEEWNPPRPLKKNGEEPVTQREKMEECMRIDLEANRNKRKTVKLDASVNGEIISLDIPVYGDDSGSETMESVISSNKPEDDPLEKIVGKEASHLLRLGIESDLTEEEKTYIMEYFGFEGAPKFEWEIAEKYGVDDLTVAKVLNSAKLKLIKNKEIWDLYGEPGK